ncbi:hypothetical protein GCM10010517_05400 [Streptosporangium fragile]|uniref:Thioesterase domain-containing protein n=1 Tax=Streptosporangium fragile TaxID=46186 RepID=A0ABP6I633_9ACTN
MILGTSAGAVGIVHVGGPEDPDVPPFFFFADPRFTATAAAGFPRAFLSVEPAELNAAVAAGPSVGQAAALYGRAILDRQPEGPFHLGGFCVTGLLAIEVGHWLLDRGHDVDFLVLVDTLHPAVCPPYTPDLKLTLGGQLLRDPRVGEAADRLEERRRRGPLPNADIVRELRPVIAAASHHLLDVEEDFLEDDEREEITDRFTAYLYQALTSWSYEGRPYHGELTFIANRTGFTPDGLGGDGLAVSEELWREQAAGGFVHISVDNDDQECPHMTMLESATVPGYLRSRLAPGAA